MKNLPKMATICQSPCPHQLPKQSHIYKCINSCFLDLNFRLKQFYAFYALCVQSHAKNRAKILGEAGLDARHKYEGISLINHKEI